MTRQRVTDDRGCEHCGGCGWIHSPLLLCADCDGSGRYTDMCLTPQTPLTDPRPTQEGK